MGPLVTAQHRDKVRGYVDTGVPKGAELVVDGRGLKLQGSENGFFLGGSPVRPRQPDMRSTARRSSGRCWSVVRAGSYARRWR
jgi:malonate-semialdehyde dehydrogenase (acetylating)/methylmalonate-semialdehyde dehydrogenase